MDDSIEKWLQEVVATRLAHDPQYATSAEDALGRLRTSLMALRSSMPARVESSTAHATIKDAVKLCAQENRHYSEALMELVTLLNLQLNDTLGPRTDKLGQVVNKQAEQWNNLINSRVLPRIKDLETRMTVMEARWASLVELTAAFSKNPSSGPSA